MATGAANAGPLQAEAASVHADVRRGARVIARSVSSEAIQEYIRGDSLDCFASLAMTKGGLRPPHHPFASEATASISISIFGSGSACTTQVVRAG